jgi:hypothetical protein
MCIIFRAPAADASAASYCAEALEEGIDYLALDEDAVGAGIRRGPVQRKVAVPGEGDQTQSRVLTP